MRLYSYELTKTSRKGKKMQTDFAKNVYDTWINTYKDCPQTAKICHISERYVYTVLKGYCEQENISYRDTLRRPHKQHVRQKYTVKVIKRLESKSAYDEDFEYIQLLLEDSNKVKNILEAIKLMQKIVDKFLKEMEL